MTVAAAPPSPQRVAVAAWDDAFASLTKDLKTWAARIADGMPPLTPTEQSRLSSLVAAVQQIRAMPDANAQITAAALERATNAARESMVAAQAALPKHVLATAQEALEAVGWDPVPNPVAVAQVVNGGIGQVTGDFARLTPAVQSRIIGDIATSIAVGEHPRDLARRLSESLEPAFMGGQSRSVTVARTVTARAYDQASLFTYQQAAAKGVVYGWRWVARPGACEVCRTLHGTVFPPGEDTYRHPNCTCVTVPVLFDEPAAQTPFGDRFDPYDGTDPGAVVRRTSQSGWTSWQKAPKADVSPSTPPLFVADKGTGLGSQWIEIADPDQRAANFWAQTFEGQQSTMTAVRNARAGIDPLDGIDFEAKPMQMLIQGRQTLADGSRVYYEIEDLQNDILNAARVFSRPPTVTDQTLLRGMRLDDVESLFDVGDWLDLDLVSASSDPIEALLYAKEGVHAGSQAVLVEIDPGVASFDLTDLLSVGRLSGSHEHVVVDRLVVQAVYPPSEYAGPMIPGQQVPWRVVLGLG